MVYFGLKKANWYWIEGGRKTVLEGNVRKYLEQNLYVNNNYIKNKDDIRGVKG